MFQLTCSSSRVPFCDVPVEPRPTAGGRCRPAACFPDASARTFDVHDQRPGKFAGTAVAPNGQQPKARPGLRGVLWLLGLRGADGQQVCLMETGTVVETTGGGEKYLFWLLVLFLLGLVIGLALMACCCCGLRAWERQKVETQSRSTQSQVTYTRWKSQPRFHPLPDESHGGWTVA